MRILIAPDKFKGSLNAGEAAEAILAGLGAELASSCRLLPIADGGEGTAEALLAALGGEWVCCEAFDALGRAMETGYAVLRDGAAILEMSQASGLWRLTTAERDPVRASTFGTGVMIRDAVEKRGATRIVLGIGGSATNDGGSGLARALGFRFLDETGAEIRDLPRQLLDAAKIDASTAIRLPEFVTACDVDNPLLGPAGATRVYGPQKGVAPADFDLHERRLRHLAKLVEHDLGVVARDRPGAGAAGGLGFGTIAFCGAELRSGFELVAELLNLEERVAEADLVITGEGSLDVQTLHGKGPHGVALLARKLGKPVLAFAGRTDGSPQLAQAFDRIETLQADGISIEESMRRGAELLTEAAKRTAPWIRAQLKA